MSWLATYDPLNVTVPNVVTNWDEVELPSGAPNTVDNPDISLLGTNDYQVIHPEYNCTIDRLNNALVPFTAQQQTAWTLAQQQSQENSTVVQAKAYLTGGDSISLVIQAIIEVLPNTQQQTVQSLTAQILTNIDQLSLKTQQGQL